MDLSVKLFRVYKQDEDMNLENMGVVETERHRPNAEEIGNAYGEGTFLTYHETEDNASRNNDDHINGYWKVIVSTHYFSEHWEDTNGS